MELDNFIDEYVKSIEAENAAVFAGAGLSIPSGFCDWKNLLREPAKEIGLNIDKENDLTNVAQFYVNENGGVKTKLITKLFENFNSVIKPNINHEILASLPIKTFWTTNYDTLIEQSLEANCKVVDIKKCSKDLVYTKRNRDVVLYKMHGDINTPTNTIITKDDYVTYSKKENLLVNTLCGDMASKRFLFIGFSFTDPNLENVLNQLKCCLGENVNTHYCLMKRVLDTDFADIATSKYEQVKQNLRINDLKRYGINVILLDSYEEITSILKKIKHSVQRKNIFISGSASAYGEMDKAVLEELARNLARNLINQHYNIISGYGLGIGSSVIQGAISELYDNGTCKIGQRIISRPFPTSQSSIEHWDKYRKDMISNAGIAIFLSGNKLENGKIVDATGVYNEFKIAIENHIIPIPIPATEFMAKKLYDIIMSDFDKYVGYPSSKTFYEQLGKETDVTKIQEIIIQIIQEVLKGD